MQTVPLTAETAMARCEELKARDPATLTPDEIEATLAELEELSEYLRSHADELKVYARRRNLRVVE